MSLLSQSLLIAGALLILGFAAWPILRRHLRGFVSGCMRSALRLRSHPYPVTDDVSTLVIAPHQDDETLGCGGMLACKRSEGVKVRVAFITDGSGSHPHHPTLLPSRLSDQRRLEALEAASILGVERAGLTFMGETDGSLAHLTAGETEALVARLVALIETEQPEEILLPCRHDGSSEHDASFKLVKRALARTTRKPRLLEFPIWSWWNPRLLIRPLFTSRKIWRVHFRGHDALKRQAIAAYQSQIEPAAPWSTPVLSPEFISYFSGHEEFFLES